MRRVCRFTAKAHNLLWITFGEMKMIKFDKEKALAGEPVIVSGVGLEVKELRFYPDGRAYPWEGLLGYQPGTWTIEGKYRINTAVYSRFDLGMAQQPEPVPEPEPELLTWYAIIGESPNNNYTHKSSLTECNRVVTFKTKDMSFAVKIKESYFPDCDVIEVKGKKLFNVKDIK